MKDIQGYEGLYKVTMEGKVYSLISSSFLSPFKRGAGYLAVALCKEGQKKGKKLNKPVRDRASKRAAWEF